jgi:hypothetical protein
MASGRRLRLLIAPMLVLALASVVSAQRYYRLMEGYGVPIRFAPADVADGRFTACKLMYTSTRGEEGGIGWATDYPFAAVNMMMRLAELTKTPVSRDKAHEINYWVVRLTDPSLFGCPFVMASDVGTLSFSEKEVTQLRTYLLKGGFLWVDDFWGTIAWNHWVIEIQRALPEFPIFAVAEDHPVRTALFAVHEVPQVSSIQFWRGSGGSSSERGSDSPFADMHAIADATGRVMVVMTHNTDIADSMEREGEDPDFFHRFSPPGYALATDIVLYALTH